MYEGSSRRKPLYETSICTDRYWGWTSRGQWSVLNQDVADHRVDIWVEHESGAKPRRCYMTWTAGFAIDCVACNGSSGRRRRKAELIRLGLAQELAHTTAWSAKGSWRMSHTPGIRLALNNGYFDALGLPRLNPRVRI